MSSFIRKAALIFSSCLSLFFLSYLPLPAAEISLEIQVGFRDLFHLGYPFPLSVEVNNSGQPVKGTVEVRVWKGGPSRGVGFYPLEYRKEIFLSAQSRKRVSFTVDPDSLSRPLTVNFFSPREKLSKEVDLRRHFSPSPLVLLITENSLAPSIPLAAIAPSPLIALTHAHLPADPRAYRGVSTVLLYEPSLRDLSRNQLTALERWVSLGGRMLVLGSVHFALYQEPSMGRFLPVRVQGVRRFSSLPTLERIYGGRAPPLRDVLVQESRPVDGRVLIEERGTPIVVEMSRGRGKVLYLSLDVGRPPLARWEGLAALLKDLLGSPAPEERRILAVHWDEPLFSQLLATPSFISAYVPTRPLFLWLLFYLGALGWLARLWERKRFPARTLILSLLALVVCAAGAGYFHFIRAGKTLDGVLFSSTLMEALPDGYVAAESDVALFSTQSRHFDLQAESGWSDVEPVLSRQGRSEQPPLVVQDEGDSTRFRFALRGWSFRLFRFRSVSHFPIRTEIERRGEKIRLKLANLSSKDLTDCWLVFSGQGFFLGDLLRGTSQSREFSLSPQKPAVSQPNRRALREISFEDKTREFLFRYSFFPGDSGAGYGDGTDAVLLGWVRGLSRRFWVEDARISAQEHTFFHAVLPLGQEEDE